MSQPLQMVKERGCSEIGGRRSRVENRMGPCFVNRNLMRRNGNELTSRSPVACYGSEADVPFKGVCYSTGCMRRLSSEHGCMISSCQHPERVIAAISLSTDEHQPSRTTRTTVVPTDTVPSGPGHTNCSSLCNIHTMKKHKQLYHEPASFACFLEKVRCRTSEQCKTALLPFERLKLHNSYLTRNYIPLTRLHKCTLFIVLLCLAHVSNTSAGRSGIFRNGRSRITMPGYLAHPQMMRARPDAFRSRWLYPSVVNLASQADISTNATCGLNGPVKYCKLVEHVDRSIARRGRQCSMCDAYSIIPSERHSVQHAIDGRGDRWWQSPTIEQGYNYHWVTINLDLRQVFQIAYVIVKAANSPRPGNWILEKSIDGVTWFPWQYFATSDSECFSAYGLPAAREGAPKYRHDTEVMCTSYFSQLIPLENGEIHVSLINGRPSAENPSPELVTFTSARHVRLRMQKIRTLHGDLMTLSSNSAVYADPLVTRRYYYSIKDISIGGMCICYGHASTCPADPRTGLFSCECEHNTAGPNCEACAPGYSQYEWKPGNYGFQCEECNCNGHSDDCFYDADVAERGGSLNIHGDYLGGGVCVGCRDSTEGVNCETCIDGFYRPIEVEPDAPNPCRQCNCDPFGGARVPTDTGPYVCVKDVTFIDVDKNLFPGSCYCKEGYTGTRCDSCTFGYRGFPLCEPCPCNIAGSLNDDPCEGGCICKENVMGRGCSHCISGHYNLQRDNPLGCDQCYCSGVSQSCLSSNLTWTTVQTNQGWEVRDRRGRRRSTAQFDPELAEPYVEHGQAARDVGSTMYYWSAPRAYLGERLSSYGGNLRYIVSYDILQGSAALPIQDADVILEGNGKTLIYNYRGTLVDPQVETEVNLKLAPGGSDHGWVESETRRPINKEDMMIALRDVTRLLIRAVYSRNNGAVYRIRDVYLETATSNSDGAVAHTVEQCNCPLGYSGSSCENCINGYWRSGKYCLACRCNDHSDVCNPLNGACQNCRDNTMGTHCERCKPGYYGDATWGTPRDCQRCSCPLPISSNNFSPTCRLDRASADMVCLECPVGYAGKRCERCAEGYYGEPATPGSTCQLCQCNGNSRSCDRITGVCLECQGHTAGDHCERCEAAYYGDAIGRKNCGPCDCNPIGSVSRQCDAVTGQCPCTRDVYGRKCDACTNDHYLNVDARMCVSCDCDHTGSLTTQCSGDGTCVCRIGVTGQLCDSCANGYYGFASTGCTECICEHTNGNCDSVTGECVCPPNTYGFGCTQCVAGSYQWEQHVGCKTCNCSEVGSLSSACNVVTGQCQCKGQYGGRDCGQCSEGYYGYPSCLACECNARGTEQSTCSDSGMCTCSDDGQCSCKANAIGKRCDQCSAGSFGLSGENDLGCTSCFCSGVTNECAQASYVWGSPVSLNVAPVEVTNQINTRSSTDGVLFTQNVVTFDANAVKLSFRPEPYYWRLPPQFNGDKSLSYGGKLRYTIHYVSEISAAPGRESGASVVLRGGRDPTRTIQYTMADPITGQTKPYVVLMKEFGWTHLETKRNVTREEFAEVLQDIQFFLIKASYGYLLDQSRLSDVFLDIAIPGQSGRGDDASSFPSAIGLEECVCPPGYSGLSCQECSSGYMKIQQGPTIGRCEPCNCYNRSETCVKQTGECLNCADKFTGRHCELCVSGYYLAGDTCLKCACPSSHVSNNFSPTCHADGADGITDYTCDACRPGYVGKHCEMCADGYFGDPLSPGGFCAKCGCNVAGSINGVCNKVTGQCHCDVGIQGRVCDQCLPRHVITSNGCIACGDECIGTLLDEVERLANKTGNIDIRNMFPPPWNRLIAARNVTAQMQENITNFVNQITNVANLLAKIPANITDFNERLGSLGSQAEGCAGNTNEFLARVDVTGDLVETMQQNMRNLFNQVKGLSRGTSRLLTQLRNGTAEDAANMQASVNRWISEMRNRNMTGYRALAEKEISSAEDLLSFLRSNFTERVKQVKKRFHAKEEMLFNMYDTLIANLHDLKDQLSNSSVTMNITDGMNDLNRQTLRQSDGNIDRVNNEAIITNVMVEQAQSILNMAMKLYEGGNGLLEMLVRRDSIKQQLQDEVDGLNRLMETNLNPSPTGLMMKVKVRVEGHKTDLQNAADYLSEVYRNISQISYNQTEAASRWTKIARIYDKAKKTANTALKKAKKALTMTTEDLGARAEASLQRSDTIYNDILSISNTVTGDRDQLRTLNDRLRSENHSARALNRLHDKILARIKKARSGGLKTITPQEVINAAARASQVLNRIENDRDSFQNLYRQLDVVDHNTQEHEGIFQQASSNLAEVPNNLDRANAAADRANFNLRRLKLVNDTVRQNITNLRKLIEDTRRKAASIRSVSVKSTGRCAILYKPPLLSGKITEVILNVQTTEPNNMLFYLARKRQDYIAVELRERTVAVTWDLGGGQGFVQNPLRVESEGSSDWFRIEVMRRNQEVTVTVYRTANKTATIRTAVGTSPGSFAMLDISTDDMLFVGGIVNTTMVHDAVAYRTFTGCMGEAYLQGRSVGLWNFKNISNADDCRGCVESDPINAEEQLSDLFSYTGHSYSVLSLPSFTPQQTIVSLRFQTFSSEGLLFYMGSVDLPDFLSLELRDGRLLMKIDVGQGVYNTSTIERYNTGEWIFVSVASKDHYALLNVAKTNSTPEVYFSVEMSAEGDTGLDLTQADRLCVGGFPNELIIRQNFGFTVRANVTRVSFVGCIRDFQFNRRLRPLKSTGVGDVITDAGVSTTCPAKITRDIGISQGGHVELLPINLHPTGSISMTFNTRESDALLLLATSQGGGRNSRRRRRRPADESFYSIYLSGGRVHARMHLPGGEVLNISSIYRFYDNGIAHMVTLRRDGANVTLQMNEDSDHVTAFLTRNTDAPITVRRMFVGGVPASFDIAHIAGVRSSLNGCLRDLMANNLVDFKKAVVATNSFLGTCEYVRTDPPPLFTSAAPPMSNISNAIVPPKPPRSTTTAATSPMKDGEGVFALPTPRSNDPYCRPPGTFAVRKTFAHFGLSPNSHLQFALTKKITKRFTFELRIRTFDSNGLLLYAGHQSQSDFFALKLKEGIPVFQFNNGMGAAEAVGVRAINNGAWHKIRIRRSKRRGSLNVDKQKKIKFLAAKGASQMDVENVLYVGGLPNDYDLTRVGKIHKSMDVCIRNLTLNKRMKLEPINAALTYKVQPCYKNVVRGAYFNGSGHAMYKEKYRVGPKMMIELQFRTWRADGILLSVDSKRPDGLALEMVNGTIYFRTDNGDGAFETMQSLPDEMPKGGRNRQPTYRLCDGRWHTVRAEKSMNTLRLTVDGTSAPDVIDDGGTFSADTKDPLFIGGIPDGHHVQKQLRTSQNFEGCIRNLRLKGAPVAFDEMVERHGIFPNSCPVSKTKAHVT